MKQLTIKKPDALTVLFNTLFPEKNSFRCDLAPSAAHCLVRVMGHLKGDKYLRNTVPSTEEGVLLPFGVNF